MAMRSKILDLFALSRLSARSLVIFLISYDFVDLYFGHSELKYRNDEDVFTPGRKSRNSQQRRLGAQHEVHVMD